MPVKAPVVVALVPASLPMGVKPLVAVLLASMSTASA
jgi:hypothetical protein